MRVNAEGVVSSDSFNWLCDVVQGRLCAGIHAVPLSGCDTCAYHGLGACRAGVLTGDRALALCHPAVLSESKQLSTRLRHWESREMFPHIHAFRSPPVPMHANRRPCALGADLRCSMISLPKLIYRLVLAVADGPPLVLRRTCPRRTETSAAERASRSERYTSRSVRDCTEHRSSSLASPMLTTTRSRYLWVQRGSDVGRSSITTTGPS